MKCVDSTCENMRRNTESGIQHRHSHSSENVPTYTHTWHNSIQHPPTCWTGECIRVGVHARGRDWQRADPQYSVGHTTTTQKNRKPTQASLSRISGRSSQTLSRARWGLIRRQLRVPWVEAARTCCSVNTLTPFVPTTPTCLSHSFKFAYGQDSQLP